MAALAGAVPGLLPFLLGIGWLYYSLSGVAGLLFSHGAVPGEVAVLALLVQGSLLAAGLPVLVVMGAVRLLGPALAPLLALAPSVGRWVATRPAGTWP